MKIGAMFPAGRISRALVAGAVGALLFGCAPMQTRVPLNVETAIHQRAAVETFSTGFASIHDKYLRPVSVESLATDGLRGLGAIDPHLGVTVGGGNIVMTEDGRPFARFREPATEDVDGWATLTADAAAASRDVSEAMQEASLERVYTAVFDGALSHLDRFSRYAGAEQAEEQRSRRDGFSGIGIELRFYNGAMRVTAVMRHTPAERAGLRPNDRIVRIDGRLTATMSARQAISMLRGEIDSRVVLTVERDSEGPIQVAIRRAHIVPSTTIARYLKDVAVIRITSFNQETANSVSRLVEAAHRDLGPALRGIVLDLRGNPGGLLQQAIRVADLFLTEGVIMTTRGRHPESVHLYQAGGSDAALGLPVIVMIDGKSASAAEIVAAALQDRGRAVVVGTNSFGKGTVQTVIRLPNDGELTLTWSRLVTPSGYVLHGLGVHPSICTTEAPGDDVGAIRRFIRDNRPRTTATMLAWRRAGDHSEEEARALRRDCPASGHHGVGDMEIARQLIDHRSLYADALDLTSTSTAARP